MTNGTEKKNQAQAEDQTQAAGNFAAAEIDERYGNSTRERFALQKVQRVLEKTVGGLADFVPFAWRHPVTLAGKKKVSKTLRGIVAAESARRDPVPAQKPED